MIKRAKTILGEYWLRCDKCWNLIEVFETEKEALSIQKQCPGYNKKTKKLLCLDCLNNQRSVCRS